MVRRLIAIVLALCIFSGLLPDAFADPADDYIENKNRQQELLDAIARDDKVAAELEDQSVALQQEANELQGEILFTLEAADTLLARMDEMKSDIEALEMELSDRRSAYYARIREKEERGNTGYLSIIFSATSLVDVFSKAACVDELLQYDMNELEKLETAEQQLLQKKEALADLVGDYNNSAKQLRYTQSRLNAKAAALKVQISSMKDDRAAALLELEQLQVLERELSRRISGEKREESQDPNTVYLQNVFNTGEYMSSPLGAEIVRYALQFLGGEYIWGGAKPEDGGFDCSGLVYYAYSMFGYRLHRVASEQFRHDGFLVDRGDLRPGDLVFFRHLDTAGVQHVGFYIGNGFVLHASSPTNGIIVSDLNSAWYSACYLGAKRIIS